jgi:putative component of toxin-antitoxin plasmid stabilization module
VRCCMRSQLQQARALQLHVVQGYVLLLAGGDKSTQENDIAKARRLAEEYQE